MADARVLVVEDDSAMRRVIERMLDDAGYACEGAGSVAEARALLAGGSFDLVVADVRLPDESGIRLVEDLGGEIKTAVLMVSAIDNPEVAHEAAVKGASGYLLKPFTPNELLINVDSALQEAHRRELWSRVAEGELQEREAEVWSVLKRIDRGDPGKSDAEALLRPLSEAVASRDFETGAHISRIGEFSALLAAAHGLSREEVEAIRVAAPMHDVGKLAIPDSVLFKPGELNQDERAMIERHATIGHDILYGLDSELLGLAAEIALSHHERFDGSGYPQGLSGHDIPISGRIVAVADVYDALTQDRPYRVAMPVGEAVDLMREGRGSHFDPDLLDLFIDRLDEVAELAAMLPEATRGTALDRSGSPPAEPLPGSRSTPS